MVMYEDDFHLIINVEDIDVLQDLNSELMLIDYYVNQAILNVVIEGKNH